MSRIPLPLTGDERTARAQGRFVTDRPADAPDELRSPDRADAVVAAREHLETGGVAVEPVEA